MKEFDNQLDKKFDFDFSEPDKTQIDIQKLRRFLEKDKKAVLVFYGGEPLLELEKIKQIIDNISVPFRMQTNGKLLNKLPINYLNKIDKILVSIDGNKKRTDYNRGAGTYDSVLDNIKQARKQGYKGEIVARMTISEFPDIFNQLKNLMDTKLFDSYHWQIDSGFYKFDYNKSKFEKFSNEYNSQIKKLIKLWLKELKKGKVIKFYPLLAIADSILKNEKTLLRCGAGYAGYAISTTGKIVACPIMNSIKNFEAGNLDSNPSKLKKFSIEECDLCDYKNLCGGRCLYWRKATLWPEEGDKQICKNIKFLIDEIRKVIPEIKELIKKKIISEKDFEYEKYFGPEIIP